MNHLRTIILSAFYFITPFCCQAQSFDKKDPIDKSYEECLQKDTSAINLSNCAYEAYSQWDRELNKSYNKLVKELVIPKDKAAFLQSQKAWLAYRDAEFHLYDNMLNKPGEKWTFERANDRVNLVKHRVLQLRGYYQILSSKN